MAVIHAYLGIVALATLATFAYVIRGLKADFARLGVAGRRPARTRRAA